MCEKLEKKEPTKACSWCKKNPTCKTQRLYGKGVCDDYEVADYKGQAGALPKDRKLPEGLPAMRINCPSCNAKLVAQETSYRTLPFFMKTVQYCFLCKCGRYWRLRLRPRW